MTHDRLLLFTGNANPELAAEIAGNLDVALGNSSVKRFADGEIYLQIRKTFAAAMFS